MSSAELEHSLEHRTVHKAAQVCLELVARRLEQSCQEAHPGLCERGGKLQRSTFEQLRSVGGVPVELHQLLFDLAVRLEVNNLDASMIPWRHPHKTR